MPGKKRYGTVGTQGNPAWVDQSAIGIDAAAKTTKAEYYNKIYPAPMIPVPDTNSTTPYTDEEMRKLAEADFYATNVQGNPLIWPEYPNGVDQTYSQAPNLPADVPIGANGLPSTAFSPNPAPPGASTDGSVNIPNGGPTGQPDLGLDLTKDAALAAKSQNIKNPAATRVTISDANKKGTIVLGGSGGTSAITYEK
jgi:hypothetical protein